MTAPRWLALVIIATATVFAPSASAQWNPITTGIEYREFAAPGPNEVFVTRLDRNDENLIIDTAIAQGELQQGREVVSSMATSQEDKLIHWNGSWGPRLDPVVAINGSFFDLTTGIPEGGQITGGTYVKRFTDFGSNSGFGFGDDRTPFIGGCVRHRPEKNFIHFANGGQLEFRAINLQGESVAVFTHHRAANGRSPGVGTEALIRLAEPFAILPSPHAVAGEVVEIRQGGPPFAIPFDHVVVAATGDAQDDLSAAARPGSEVGFSQELSNYDHACRANDTTVDWTRTYASIGGSFHFLDDGAIPSFDDPGATARHPRTAVAYNDSHIFFIVVDGRSGTSVGMSMDELGRFSRDELDAREGIAQDGGGSSTLWVDGSIRNRPSDGAERPVANSLMMARLDAPLRSASFAPGDRVPLDHAGSLRLGPGSHYAVVASVAAGAELAILAHAANGLMAEGDHRWFGSVGGDVGWIEEQTISDESPVIAVDAGPAPVADGGVPVTPPTPTADGGSMPPQGTNMAMVGGSCGCRLASRSRSESLPQGWAWPWLLVAAWSMRSKGERSARRAAKRSS